MWLSRALLPVSDMAFGDATNPLRCSRLASIGKCPLRVFILEFLDSEDDEGGPAAQSGSLTHAGVAAFHQTPGKVDARVAAAWNAVAAMRGKFPLAEPDEVRLFLTPYMADPRNINAKFAVIPKGFPRAGEPAVEYPIEFKLEPHALDPIKAPIHVQGTLDQIRIDANGFHEVHDLKTGKPTAWSMIHDYAIQQAAYTHGAMAIFPHAKWRGPKIIRNYAYRERGADLPSPSGALLGMGFNTEAIADLLDGVRLEVALIRMGEIKVSPGSHCSYCELGGLVGCLPRIRAIMAGAKPSDPFIQLERKNF